MKERLQRFDDTFMGINYGVIGPIIGILIFYYMSFADKISLDRYLDFIARTEILSSVISLGAIVNLAIFSFCLWLNADKAARGVVIATLFWGLIVIYLKFIA